MDEKGETKKLDSLHKVWGTITLVFGGIGGAIALLTLAVMALEGVFLEIKAETETSWGFFLLIMLLGLFFAAAWSLIPILAGVYLRRPYVKSKDPLIVAAILSFLTSLLNLIIAIGVMASGEAVIAFFYFICAGWEIATGVFLLQKQTAAPRVQFRFEGCVEGLFGDYIGKKYTLRPWEVCRIGKGAGCDIQLDCPEVAETHCAVKLLPDGKFEVTDYSGGETYYENNALSNGVATVVEAEGMLVAGSPDNVFSLKSAQPVHEEKMRAQEELGMKWYKFVIYFQLFFGAFVQAASAVAYFTGMYYGKGAALIYMLHGSLRALDISMGIVSLAAAALSIYARQRLCKFKKNAVYVYYAVLIINLLQSVLYLILSSVILGQSNENFSVQLDGVILSAAVLLSCNYIYFGKRKHLFCN